MGVNSLPKTVTRKRRDCDLNPGPSAPESSPLTTRLPIHPLHHEAEKRNRFSFINKSFNTQRNLTKFSTLIVNEYCHRCYLFSSISGIYTNLRTFLCTKCVVGHYVIKHV